MPPPATQSADPGRSPGAPSAEGLWRTLGRHQIGGLVATVVDFGTMILCKETLGISPVAGTALGATLGGITNFTLGRAWVFPRHSGRFRTQALRYALVSAGGAAWNALGEYLVFERAHIQYVLARSLVAVVVSLLWNFPMQRGFVFREARA